ncbi:hypothetical protein B0H34DRAFT_650991 [Crassisporium funariophilum]|nr:hypothetical protein B0H34DRAFT_650991 [Crassisporium funariophilum]
MPSVDDKSLDGEEPLEPPSTTNISALHSVAYSGMPMHIYPYPHGLLPTQQPMRSKRRQVKNACTNCQKACKKCDDARPCLRCVKYGISEECVDSQRKERKKGIKRGPYKKRDGKGVSVEQSDVPSPQGVPVSNGVPPQAGSPIPGPYMPIGYPPGFYGQYPPLAPKPGEGPPMYSSPPYFLAPVPHIQPHLHGVSEGDSHGYPPQGFYQAAVFAPVTYHHHPPYVIPRSDGQQGPIPNQYPVYGAHIYPKHPSVSGQGEMGNGPSDGSEEHEGVNGKAD